MINSTHVLQLDTDPFGSTLTQLKTTVSKFGVMVPPIDQVSALVQDADDLLIAINDILDLAQEVDTLIEVIGEALNFLDAIPIVGEIAAVMAEAIEAIGDALEEALSALKDVQSEVINPVMDVLTDMKKGLVDIRSVVVDISQDVPGYINTIQILHFMGEIAAPIASALEGAKDPGGAATRLSALVGSFNTIGTDVGKGIDALSPVLSAIESALGVLTTMFTTLTGVNPADQHSGAASSAGSAQGTSTGFARMQNAIKPVAWVLDALSCLFNTILAPIINFILEVTGLKYLVDAAADAIFGSLGVSKDNPTLKNFAGTAKDSADPTGIKANGQTVGGDGGAAASHLWAATTAALGEYRQSGGNPTKTAVYALIGAITGTPIDSKSAPVAPPFPPMPPQLNGPGANGSFALTVDQRPAMRPARKAKRYNLAALAKQAQPDILSPNRSLLSDPRFKTVALPAIDPAQYPNCAALFSGITALIADLESLADESVTFHASLLELEHALVLPSIYSQQITVLTALLKDATDILGFFETLKVQFVKDLVAPFDAVALEQYGNVQTIAAAVPQLQTAVASLDTASQAVINAIPDFDTIQQTITRLDGWALGVSQIIGIIAQSRTTDAAKGATHTAAINDIASDVEASAKDLAVRLGTIDASVKTLLGAVRAMQQGVDVFTGELKQVSDHSDILSAKALPSAQKAAHVLGIVDSIIDPLSGLLSAENCVDAGSPLKLFGAAGVATINNAGQTAVSSADNIFVSLAAEFADKELELGQMASAVAAAATTITAQSFAAFQSNAQPLVDQLTALKQALVETKQYETTIPTLDQKGTKLLTVTNDLVDSVILCKAQNLAQALGYGCNKNPAPVLA